ncbi:ROK family transcriptional regulator [Microbacterium sulfonylureivorans]|uniref:ROK family transcriptional regulator n=1 Tax=Microbacterium sulfonylureivorans TaxID=2486854 RepID=UPI000FD89411|nr:ROK family transcriptional regulator [Microbacterium sulfonylureivorans]
MTTVDPGTPTWMRTHNDRTAFRLLLEHGPLSRSKLGKLSGLSKPTAGAMIQRLEKVGLIEAMGEVAATRGPNATVYGVRRDVMTGVAISILADTIEAVLTDPVDSDRPVVVLPVAGVERSPEHDVSAAIDAACSAAGVARSSVSVVAVGVQAAVDVASDELSFTDTLPGWPQSGARRRIEEATGMTVILDNDVNLAAIAERALGVTRDAESFAYFWIGEGLGVGIDIDGDIQRGTSGSAGEIGYLEVPRSAAALDPDAADFTDLLGGPAVAALVGSPGRPLREALDRVAADEPAWTSVADRVALALAPIVALLDPASIVLGGPTGVAGGDGLSALVQHRIDGVQYPRSDVHGARPHIAVRASTTGSESILLGARQVLVAHIRARLEAAIVA